MKKSIRLITSSIIASSILLLAGCGKNIVSTSNQLSENKTPTETNVNLTISAAASLKESLEEIKTIYAKEAPSTTLTYNFGSSGTLQQQIEQGANADIFISAAKKQMDTLDSKNLIMKDSRKDFLINDVVLVTPKNSSSITSFNDLTSDKTKIIALGEPKSVPAGEYAEEVFTKLGILDKVKTKVVYGKDVKEVLTWVETGNADAGVVYETDAKVSAKVKVIAVASSDSHKPIVYPAAIIKSSSNVDAAKKFMKFLNDDKARGVFEKYGFKLAQN